MVSKRWVRHQKENIGTRGRGRRGLTDKRMQRSDGTERTDEFTPSDVSNVVFRHKNSETLGLVHPPREGGEFPHNGVIRRIVDAIAKLSRIVFESKSSERSRSR